MYMLHIEKHSKFKEKLNIILKQDVLYVTVGDREVQESAFKKIGNAERSERDN